MAKPEYKARMKNGVLEILPFIEKRQNANGGQDVTIHVPNLTSINAFKQKILNNMATGVSQELEVENDGERNIQ